MQVMYMYYFLGYKLWVEERGLKGSRRQRRADNTFLLALDGDVDFEPAALSLLVDLMKRNKTVGAACGRIHPTGSGVLHIM
jgi:chitin synthase